MADKERPGAFLASVMAKESMKRISDALKMSELVAKGYGKSMATASKALTMQLKTSAPKSAAGLRAFQVASVAEVLRVAQYFGAEPKDIAALSAAQFHELHDVAKRGTELTTAELRKQMLQKAVAASHPPAVDPQALTKRQFVMQQTGLGAEAVAALEPAALDLAYMYARQQYEAKWAKGLLEQQPAPPQPVTTQLDHQAWLEAQRQQVAARAAKEEAHRRERLEQLRREVERLEGQSAVSVAPPVELQTQRLITLDEE